MHTYICTQTRAHTSTYTHMHARMHVHTCTRACTHAQMHTDTHMHACMPMHAHVCIPVNMHVNMCMHTWTRVLLGQGSRAWPDSTLAKLLFKIDLFQTWCLMHLRGRIGVSLSHLSGWSVAKLGLRGQTDTVTPLPEPPASLTLSSRTKKLISGNRHLTLLVSESTGCPGEGVTAQGPLHWARGGQERSWPFRGPPPTSLRRAHPLPSPHPGMWENRLQPQDCSRAPWPQRTPEAEARGRMRRE